LGLGGLINQGLAMAGELQLNDLERELAWQLVHLSEGETTTATSATSAAVSSSICGSVTFNQTDFDNNKTIVTGDSDANKRKIYKKEKKQKKNMKKITGKGNRRFDDDDGVEVIGDFTRRKIKSRYRCIVDIYISQPSLSINTSY